MTLTDPDCPHSVRDQINGGVTQEAISTLKTFIYEWESRREFLNTNPDATERFFARAALALTNAQAEREQLEARDIGTYYARQIEWSRNTFGPALRTKGVIDHIRKELHEIEAEPHDLSEWVDVIILAMDGFWRHGGTADALMPALLAKQRKNMARTWPDWRTRSEDQAIEHDRSNDAALQEQRP